jgi:hypothetical protein
MGRVAELPAHLRAAAAALYEQKQNQAHSRAMQKAHKKQIERQKVLISL